MVEKDIKDAKKIIINPYSNCKDEIFHSKSFIYRGSNERTQDFVNMFKDKRDILTVISSSDQLLNAILMGAINIDAFDISNFPKYYMWLKIGAIKSLDRDDYINFFYDAVTSNQKVYEDMYFDSIRYNLNSDIEKFWSSLLYNYDWTIITYSSIFSGEIVSKENAINKNKYLELDNYHKMRDLLANININTYEGNILNLVNRLNNRYDLVYLSNIIGYVNKVKYIEMLNRINLNENGEILTYMYDYNEREKNLFKELNVSFKKFDESNAGILVYKK